MILSKTGDGNSASIEFNFGGHMVLSQLRTVYASGVLATGTVKLQVSPDVPAISDAASRWYDVPNASWAAAAVAAGTSFMNVEVRARKWRLVNAGGVTNSQLEVV